MGISDSVLDWFSSYLTTMHFSSPSLCLVLIAYRQASMQPQDYSLGGLTLPLYSGLSTSAQDPIQILTLTYRAIHGQAPANPSQILLPYSSARPLRRLHHKIRFNLNLWLRAYLSYTHERKTFIASDGLCRDKL